MDGRHFPRPGPTRPSGKAEQVHWGNAGPGILRRPGINNWDLRITRRFRFFGERRSLEARGEMFNAFNHTQFSGLDETARFDAGGNQINALLLEPTAARRPRRVQLGLKVA